MHKRAVLIHNVRSEHNVGAIMRTADGAGLAAVYLSGYTPRPVDRFGRPVKALAKTALGAQALPWQYQRDPVSVITGLRMAGWAIVGVEQDERSRDYRDYVLARDTLFVLGNEVRGLSPALRAHCDELIEIPMHGEKESLNVSVAAGIIFFRFAPGSQ
jgi:tRNA G18 (ribose-2'-O)-methylase SpoU